MPRRRFRTRCCGCIGGSPRVAIRGGWFRPAVPTGRVEVYTVWEGSAPENWLRSSSLGLAPREAARSLAFSPDGKVLAAGTEGSGPEGGGLRVWDRVFFGQAK